MVEETGKHAAQQTNRRLDKIDPRVLEVRFNPDLKNSLDKVIKAVRNSPHMDEEFLEDLTAFASGKLNSLLVMKFMKTFTDGIAEFTSPTGEPDAEKAWNNFAMQILDPPGGKLPFTFVQRQKGLQQG